MPLGRVLSLLSAQPAALLGLKGRGTLAVGSYGDVVVFDPKAEWTYQRDRIEIESQEHSVRRLGDAGQGALDGERRAHRLHRGVKTTRSGQGTAKKRSNLRFRRERSVRHHLAIGD